MSVERAPCRGDGLAYTAMRRKAHRLRRKLGIEFTPAFDQVAQEHGFRDAQHIIHWLIGMDWWGPCDPPTLPIEEHGMLFLKVRDSIQSVKTTRPCRHTDETNTMTTLNNEDPADPSVHEQGGWALGEYVGQDCPNCGRQRLCLCPNGKHRCEKCNWCPELGTYAPNLEA